MTFGESLGKERPHDSVEDEVEPEEHLCRVLVSVRCAAHDWDVATYGSNNIFNDILGKVQVQDSGNPLCETGRQLCRSPVSIPQSVSLEASTTRQESHQSNVQLGEDAIERRASPRSDGQHNPFVLSDPAHLVVWRGIVCFFVCVLKQGASLMR